MEKNESTKVIGVIGKNPDEEIRICSVRWHDKLYLDIRLWIRANPEEGKDALPTKKGLRFSYDLLPEILGKLQKIDADLAGESAEIKEESDEQTQEAGKA